MTTGSSRWLAEAMEPRILHSADLPFTGWAGASIGSAALHHDDTAEKTPAPTAASIAHTIEIAFVDATLPDAETLLADLRAQRDAGRALEIITFGADDDALALIGQTLAGRHGVDAVHVISHGSDGTLQLGSVRLNADTLLRRAGEIAGWSAALSADADLLLYGCDLVATGLGRGLVADLAALTGADVAASTNLTGAAARGGDWVLELATGRIDTALAPSLLAQGAWSGVLNTYSADPTKADGAVGSLRWAISQANAAGGSTLHTINLAAGTYNLSIANGALGSDDANARGDLDITARISLVGASATASATVINASGIADRALNVISGGQATLSNLTVQGGNNISSGAGIEVASGATLTLNNVTVQNNDANAGGGLQNRGTATLNDSLVRNNTGNNGGGIDNTGTLTLTRTTVSGNTGQTTGGGINNKGTATLTDSWIVGNQAKTGGGLAVQGGGNSFTLNQVTISGNTAAQTGGGIYAKGAVTANNVTISGNQAGTSGGGIYVGSTGVSLTNATVVLNTAAGPGAGIHAEVAPLVPVVPLTLKNSLVALNTVGGTVANANVAQTSQGYNLSDDSSLGLNHAQDRPTASAAQIKLSTTLANNGGVTPTHALQAGSVAINVGNPAAGATDQRGTARVGTPDIGAYEFGVANQPPTITSIANQSIAEDTSTGAIAFTIGDAETAATALTVTAVSSNAALLPAGGLVLGGSGANRTVTLTPAPDANSVRDGGTATVTITVSDGSNQTTRSFTLTVTPVADAPVAVDDTAATPTSTPVDVLVLANDRDADGDTLALNSAVVDNAANGSVAIVGNAIRYTPSALASGPVTISYTAIAGGQVSNLATLTVNVGANTPPTAAGSTVTLAEDGNVAIAESQLAYADLDLQAFAALRIETLPALGALTLNGAAVTAGIVVSAADLAAGKLVYTPPPDANGAPYASFTFSVQDAGGAFSAAPATLVFDVTAVADAPRAQNDSASAAINQAVEVRVLDNDSHPDGLALTLTSVTLDDPSQGTAVISTANDARGAVLFTPAANLSGPVQLRYTVSDPAAATAQAQLIITFGANNAPTSGNVTLALAEDGSYAVNPTDIAYADVDSGQSWVALRIASLPTAGSLLINGVAAEVGDSVTPTQLAGGALVFQPAADANGTGYASLSFNVVDSAGGVSVPYTMSFDVAAVNDAPMNTLPATSLTGRNVDLVFSAANGNAIRVGDVDIGAGAASVTLSVSAGTLTLSGTGGLNFSTGSNGSAAMAFTGSLASINTALDGLRYTPATNFTGSVSLTVVSNDQGGSGSGAALADTDVMAISVVNSALWLSTEGNTTASAGSGGLSWNNGQVVELGNPNLALGSGTTAGTFGTSFNLSAFAQDGSANLVGLHVVGRSVTVGTSNAVTLQVGDLLFSVDGNETFAGLAVSQQQVILFRPTAPGNYSAGSFSVLMTQPGGINEDVRDFALVETAVTIGGTAVQAGDFLISFSGSGYDKDIWHFRATNMAGSPTGGTLSQLVNGASLGVNLTSDQIRGIELVQQDTVIGGKSLTAGQVLVSQDGDNLVGTNLLSVKDGDIFVLNVTQTGLLSAGTASMFMRGSDLGLGGGGERPDGIALVQRASNAPVLTLGTATVSFTEGGPAVAMAPAVTVTDADSSSFGGGRLTVYIDSNGSADDRLAVGNIGSGAGQIGVSGSSILYGGVLIGSVTGGVDGSTPLAVSLNASATAAAVQALLRAVEFSNVSEAPSTLIRSVAIVLTDGAGGVSSPVSRSVSVMPTNDVPTGSVTISGTAAQGQTLTASNSLADADGLGTIGYQWFADSVAISGANGNSLLLTQAQVGKTISITASYTDGYGTAESVASTATANVANVNDAPTGSVTISGTAAQGQTLTASNSLADADGLGAIGYQWFADSVAISGANGNSLLLTQAQVGKTISVTASYIDGYGTTESVAGTATANVANVNDVPTGIVTISGTAAQGQTLTASNSLADADGLGAIGYQWFADSVAISGANGNSLLLMQAQVGKTISVTASYTDGYGTAESVAGTATANVANVNDAPTGSVTISGTAAQGRTLTASNSLADADGLGAIGYQWFADNVAISGANGNSLLLTQAQVGKTISVTASYTDGYGTAETVASAATANVANVNDVPTGSVTVSGTAAQGQTLTASNSLADADGLGAIGYQWFADSVAISGATGDSLLLTPGHIGRSISVTASYIDSLGTREAVSSVQTPAVALGPDAPRLLGSIPDLTVLEDAPWRYTLPTDLFSRTSTGEALSLRATTASGGALPGWLRFDADTGTFSGTPGNDDVGLPALRITATDAYGRSAYGDFQLQIANTNDAPLLAQPLAPQATLSNVPISFQLPPASFVDPDVGDALRYQATLADGSALPGWLRFDPSRGLFTAEPGARDVGQVLVRVTATDGSGASAQGLFAFTVTAPVAAVPPAAEAPAQPPAVATPVATPAAVAPAPAPAPAPVAASEPAASAPAPEAVAKTVTTISTAVALPGTPSANLLEAPGPRSLAAVVDAPPAQAAPTPVDVPRSANVSRADAVLADAIVPQYASLTAAPLMQLLQNDDLLRKLDELQRQMAEGSLDQRGVVSSSIAVTSGLSIGYVVWLVRGGVLASSMLSALPAWQLIDPLPVLTAAGAIKGRNGKGAAADSDGDEDGDVERLFDKPERPRPSRPAVPPRAEANTPATQPTLAPEPP